MKDMGHSAAGKSLLEKLWDQLDAVVGRLMSDGEPDEGGPRDEYRRWGEDRGQAQGLAFAIATIENPYAPDVPGVKARAMERWQGDDPSSA